MTNRVPPDESSRLAALRRYEILDTSAEKSFDDVTALAASITRAPIAAISLVDVDRQWFKSRIGLEPKETSRAIAFCAHAILTPGEVFVVQDAALDERFIGNPIVTKPPKIRFYAGAPLVTPDGYALGTLCVMDRVPRTFTAAQCEDLKALSRIVIAQLELRIVVAALAAQSLELNERHLATRAHRAQLLRLVAQAPMSIAMFDRDLRYVAYSRRWLDEYGGGRESLVGMLDSEVSPTLGEDRRLAYQRGLRGETVRKEEDSWLQPDGRQYWQRWVVSPSLDETGTASGIIVFSEDLTERKARAAEVEHLTTHDALTDLPNGILLQARLTGATAKAKRAGRFVAILFIDLDRFKLLNDAYGHHFGDRVIVAVAERLSDTFRACDTLAHLGGDEFLLLLTDLARKEDAAEVAQNVLATFRRPFDIEGRELYVTASIGVGVYPDDGERPSELIRNADIAMYRAKTFGRNAYACFTQSMSADTARRVDLESNLRLAISRDELSLVYQPKVSLKTGQIIGCEALCRWTRPESGAISPVVFIPIAEETGMILPIGDWVLRTACRQNKAWQAAGLRPVVVSVNVSARQFRQENLVAWVQSVLAAEGLEPQYLELELTESILAEDTEQVIHTIGSLKQLGVKLSIDDFGTGYSSLAYLKRFHVDTLKIDQSFVRNMLLEPDDATIAFAVISLAHSLRITVIAEGVEESKQCELLRSKGCDAMQGFLYSRGVPAAALGELLRLDEPADFGLSPARARAPARTQAPLPPAGAVVSARRRPTPRPRTKQ